MKFIITLVTVMNLFANPFLNNTFLIENDTSKIPKIMDSIKAIFGIDNNQKNNIIVLDENKTNKINIDDLIVTKLETDPSSNFFWKYETSEPDMLDIIFDNYIPSIDINNGPGNETFIFKSLAKGKYKLTFTYFKQGEDSPQKNITYKIYVR